MYGYNEGRFKEYKRAVEDKNLGPLIKTIMNRCIHCTRCVRFSEDIAGVWDLGTIGRGKSTEIGTYVEKMVTSELSGNLIDLCPVGALTNSPYAFTSRPWELKSYYSIDVLDALGANTQIDTRGAEIKRVLPRVNEDVNEEWIADKGRFSYDGLKTQRLTVPLYRNKEGEFEELDWEEAMAMAAQKLSEVQGEDMSAIIGNFCDVESIVALKDFMNRLDCDNFEVRSDSTKLNADLRSSYIMNSTIRGVEFSDMLLLVGVNPKTEAPVLNARILKAVKHSGLKVALIGTPVDLGYDYIHLGNTAKSLVEIAEGTHPFSARLAGAELPMMMVGSRTLQRKDGEAILSTCHSISKSSPIINKERNWNGFNVLHHESSRVGALDVGVSSEIRPDFKPKLVYIMGADDIRTKDIPEDAFVIYQGTHGDEGAYFADLILPGAAYTEKTGTYVNTEGRVQLARLAVTPPGLARNDWEVIRALSEECGVGLPYDNHEELRYRIAELAPHLLKYDHIETSLLGELALETSQGGDINLTPLSDSVDNYYMTDAISRSSTIMAKCSIAFNPTKFSNFKTKVF